ncbi:MAG: leucine-rich repeat protein [Bacteroidaceae bacterium]|nr:leucine-rich repeat protein [Bacteroidaceae bacterium]
MKKTYLKQLFATLLLLCSTVAFASSSAPADETYTLTYVVDGETYQTATLAAGAAINLSAGPAKEGYEFVKWDLETAVPIDIASNADAMLYTNAPCTDTRYGDQFTSWQVLFDGQASTFFHSEYANNESADGLDHYLRVDMGEGNSITSFTFTYTNRNTNSYINAPKTMVVEGSNEADGEYVELATLTNLSSTDSDVYNSQVIGNGTAYRYIRYRVTETHYNQKVYEHPFFFIAEFGMADAAIPTTMPASDISLVAIYKELFGSCGESATWSLNNGVLTIGGTGAMADYANANATPWKDYRTAITTIVVGEGITHIGNNAFRAFEAATSATLPSTLTSIGNDAFYDCTNLADVEIPAGVTTIGFEAFCRCSSLTSVEIPAGITTIAEGAFSRTGLTSVTVPEGVTSIGAWAFDVCPNLAEVSLPSTLTSIGSYAFENSSNLTSITSLATTPATLGTNAFNGIGAYAVLTVLPNAMEVYEANEAWSVIPRIKAMMINVNGTCGDNIIWVLNNGVLTISGTGAMTDYYTYGDNTAPWNEYCEDITAVIIENDVTSIGDDAFFNCDGLTSVTIPNSVTSIGSSAFYDCSGLTSVTIPNSVTSIGSSAFYNCTGITSVTIGNSVTSIGSAAFANCNNLESIMALATVPPTFDNLTFYGSNPVIYVPADIVASYEASEPWSNLTIKSPVSGTCGEYATWMYGGGILIICGTGDMANYSDTGDNTAPWTEYREDITTVVIEDGVTSIGDYAFYNCTSLTSVTIPNSVTSIESRAFHYCSGLKSIYIPANVTSIGISFNYCSLKSIVVDEENSVYDSREGCNAIIETATNTLIVGSENTIIPNSVTSIGDCAFGGRNGLASITIPNSVTSIVDYAFGDCYDLTSVTIGKNVTHIEGQAFYGCTGLASIVVDEGNSVYDSREGCNAIIETATNTLIQGCMNTIIPNSVTSIGYYAFYKCTSLASVTIPNSVTSIGSWVFYNCTGLTSMEIPSSVTEVGFNAFGACEELTDIYFASNPTLGVSPFPSTATCHLTITDSDAADFNTANANTYADVSYTRTISEGKYGTIMLPFAPDEASLQNYAFYTLKEAGDGYVRFEEVATPEANTPYLYTLRAGGENAAITGGETTIAADINNGTQGCWDLVGSFTNQTIDCTDGNYYAYSAARNEINRITKTLTVSPYRAYLKSTAAQNSNLRVFIGGTTGITEISPDDIEGLGSGAVYDLYGRPVNEPAKGGIYIIDGKKVVW